MKALAGAVLAVMLLFFGGAAQAHQITFSHVEVRLNPAGTTVSLDLPIKALLQEDPTSLPVGTDEPALRGTPLPEDVSAALTQLAATRLHIAANSTALPLAVTDIHMVGDDIALSLTGPAAFGALSVQANLFPSDPLHKVFVTVFRGSALAGQYALDRQDPGFILAAPQQPIWRVVITFIGEGIHHIFIGPDHILFVLALVLLGGRLVSQIKIITAFTVAHSITLALATLNIVHLPSRLVESVIALSIVVVGLHDLWRLRKDGAAQPGRDPRVVLAFAFGLVHGFGFASVLTELELPRQALAWSLASFNIGVEIGQVTILLIAAPAIAGLRRYASPAVTRSVLTATASVVVLAGTFWFCQRALGA